jgi:hypothetical protein
MRACTLGLALCVAVLFPKVSNAQAYAYGTPAPEVTAGTADWQVNDAPIVVNGLVYYPTRAFRIFDPSAMMQSGVFQGVPIYSDVTIEPYSIVYVPVSRSNMRAYERRREGDLAGTAGSRTPSFPVDIASDTVVRNAARAAGIEAVAGTAGSVPPPAVSVEAYAADRVRARRTVVQSIPAPTATNGIWIEFKGSRWYSEGPAESFSPDRFEPVGDYRGFPVYRAKGGPANEIWVSAVKGGPLAPYSRR